MKGENSAASPTRRANSRRLSFDIAGLPEEISSRRAYRIVSSSEPGNFHPTLGAQAPGIARSRALTNAQRRAHGRSRDEYNLERAAEDERAAIGAYGRCEVERVLAGGRRPGCGEVDNHPGRGCSEPKEGNDRRDVGAMCSIVRDRDALVIAHVGRALAVVVDRLAVIAARAERDEACDAHRDHACTGDTEANEAARAARANRCTRL